MQCIATTNPRHTTSGVPLYIPTHSSTKLAFAPSYLLRALSLHISAEERVSASLPLLPKGTLVRKLAISLPLLFFVFHHSFNSRIHINSFKVCSTLSTVVSLLHFSSSLSLFSFR
nr:hypothetical protein Iba_chr04bCG7980 [Ipomoea batatas]